MEVEDQISPITLLVVDLVEEVDLPLVLPETAQRLKEITGGREPERAPLLPVAVAVVNRPSVLTGGQVLAVRVEPV